jgi:hypothetical protein
MRNVVPLYDQQEPLVSVIVPCRNHARELRDCLRSLLLQQVGVPYEVLVVESGADPEVAATVRRFPTVRLIRSDQPLLPGAARNLGALSSRGQYLAFIDADCTAEPKWLAGALNALQSGAKMVTGPVSDADPFHPVAVADNVLQFTDFSTRRPDGEATHCPGCNFAIQRQDFWQVGGFREELSAGEDVLMSTAAAARWPGLVRFANLMRVRHRGRRKMAAFRRHQQEFGFHRGVLGLRLSSSYQRLGRLALASVLVVFRRLGYIVVRTLRWNPAGVFRLVLVLPLLLTGLTWWAQGFRKGCRAAEEVV